MDFSQFIDNLERHPTHTASIAAKIGHSKFWVNKILCFSFQKSSTMIILGYEGEDNSAFLAAHCQSE